MKEKKFRSLLKSHLIPMFEGIQPKNTEETQEAGDLVSLIDHRTIAVRPVRDCGYRIHLFRRQAFTGEERDLIECFMKEVSRIANKTDSRYYENTLDALPSRVISSHLAWRGKGGSRAEATIYEALRHFEQLAAQTYEGKPITGAIGITGSVTNGEVSLGDLWEEDFARVLSNGYDTMYLCGSDKKVLSLLSLDTPEEAESASEGKLSFYPNRLGPIAKWATIGKKKVAISLNRNGELLVFKSEALQFAKRRGKWIYFPHGSNITRLGTGTARSLREEIYKSCLDVSFARTGACICVVSKSKKSLVGTYINPKDLFAMLTSDKTKTKLLRKTVNHHFGKLDRRIRQGLLAIDGATVLDHTGKVLAVGAIVKVPGGSEGGGGRKAAAIALSALGLGIKVSSDGPIIAFREGELVLSIGTRDKNPVPGPNQAQQTPTASPTP